MSNLVKWWDGRSTLEKAGLGAAREFASRPGGLVRWLVG